jgi:putative FmdB family regulatory protein
MPVYEYRCENDHIFEVMQRMSDDPVQSCEVCEAPVQRVFHPVAVHFKGSGFYNTDYGKKRRGAGEDSGGGDDKKPDSKSGDSSSGGKSESSSKPASSASSSD